MSRRRTSGDKVVVNAYRQGYKVPVKDLEYDNYGNVRRRTIKDYLAFHYPHLKADELIYLDKVYRELLWSLDGYEFTKNAIANSHVFKKRIIRAVTNQIYARDLRESLVNNLVRRMNNRQDKELVLEIIEMYYKK